MVEATIEQYSAQKKNKRTRYNAHGARNNNNVNNRWRRDAFIAKLNTNGGRRKTENIIFITT